MNNASNNSSFNIGITGTTGFIGSALAARLNSYGFKATEFGRESHKIGDRPKVYLDLSKKFDIENELATVDCLIHCAGIAHNKFKPESEREHEYLYQRVNSEAVNQLAEQASKARVKRFIFLSSVNVIGIQTSSGRRNSHISALNPSCSASEAKARAEESLREIAERTGMEVTIIRPPLVYGPGVKANFAAMMRLSARNLPLPLASVRNKRSLVALDNLVDLIVTCISHPKAGNQTFMVSDDADVSTPELLSAMTRAYGKSPRLLPCPPALLSFGAGLLGKKAVADRLLGSLQVDIEHTKRTLNWQPRVKLEDVLKEMVRDSVV